MHDARNSSNMIEHASIYPEERYGPAKVIEEYILKSNRFKKVNNIDSIIYAKKLKDRSQIELFKNELQAFLLLSYLKFDRFLGESGLFLKNKSPKLYFLLRRMKNLLFKKTKIFYKNS